MTTDRWLTRTRDGADARVRLFVLPHAGAGSSVAAGWAAELAPDIDVVAVCPPGRERHLTVPPHRRMSDLVDELLPVLAPLLHERCAFFGHSLGALVAYEAARRLEPDGIVLEHLFVSASAPPHRPRHTLDPRGRTDDNLLTTLSGYGGIPTQLAADAAVLALVMPPLRADLEIAVDYAVHEPLPLTCPVTALGGDHDPSTDPAVLDHWGELTTGTFARHVLPGDHFYLRAQRHDVIDLVARALLEPAGVTSHPTPTDHRYRPAAGVRRPKETCT